MERGNPVARKVFSLLAAVMVVLGACSNGDDDARGGEVDANSVTIAGFLFSPDHLRVASGATVTWTNFDDIAHTVTSGVPDAPGDAFPPSGNKTKDQTYQHAFTTPGSFAYFCSNHNGMRGTIEVT